MHYKQINNLYLKEFLGHSEELTTLYHVDRNEFDKNWIKVKSSIANSILSLYEFTNFLFKNDKFEKQDIRYYTSYIDLILSKIRHSLFTETPKKSLVDIHTYTSNEIAYLGEELLNYSEINSDFDIDFHRFIFKTFLMYDFIFYDKNGVFTRFDLNKDLYNRIKKNTLQFKSADDNSFRDFGKDIIKNILLETLSTETKNVYKTYVNKCEEKSILIEPLSYYLGYKIWKMAKIIQSTLEFYDDAEMINDKKEFDELFNKYLESSIKAIDDFYQGNTTNRDLFSTLGKLDRTILENKLLTSILPPYVSKNIKIDKVVSIEEYRKSYDIKKVKPVKEIVQNMLSDSEHDRFKFYRVLANKTILIDDLAYLIEHMSHQIHKNDNMEIIGMLRSGVLLAHCVNITKNLNKPIYMFSSFPYISILSRTALSKNSNILLIDESIKSGFSAMLASLYKQRTMYLNGSSLHDYRISINTIVDFVDFPKENVEMSHTSLVSIKSSNIEIDVSEDIPKYKIDKIFNWEKYFTDLKEPKIDFDDIIINVGGINRIDITRILMNSHLLFSIAKSFAEKLSEINEEKLILYASTDEGKILVDCTVLAYKALYKGKSKEFVLKIKNAKEAIKNGTKLIFIDMSIDTMHTLTRSLKIDFNITEKDMFLAMTILSSKNVLYKTNTLHYIDLLRKATD